MPVTLSNPYTTIERVKNECKYPLDDTALDDWFNTCINDASRMVEELTNRDFLPHDHSSSPLTLKTHWVVSDIIFLPWPVSSLTEITVDGEAVPSDEYAYENNDIQRGGAKIYRSGATWTGVPIGRTLGDGISDTDENEVSRRRLFGEPRKYTTFNPASLTITMSGVFGYTQADSESVPSDMPTGVIRACTLIAAMLSGENRKEVVQGSDGRESMGNYRIPEEAKELLSSYVSMVM